MDIARPDEVYDFPNSLPIEVSYKNAQTYYKCSSYDSRLLEQGYVWHQIVVQHNGILRGRNSMQEILDAIFETVEGEELFPVAYRRGAKYDNFLVRQCKGAINKLFENNLRVQLSDGSFIHLQVNLNVGDFKFGQISPHAKVTEALNRLYSCMERVNGVDGILNLCRFNTQPEFFDLVVNLGNRAVFELVCNLIYRNDEKFRLINGLILRDNSITTVAPLTVFAGVNFVVLDLSKNKIISSSRICRDLSEVKADELFLAGNPVTNGNNYPECLRPIQKNVKLIDNIEVKSKGFLNSQKNFLCDVKGYEFVNEFVPWFFKCFDSHDRQSLKELYHQNAIFTISFNYVIAQMTSQNFKRISKYRENCRNILKMSALSRAHTSIHLGADQIMQVFFQLPSMRHDMLTFNTDTMIYNENMIAITIHGVFYDQAPSMMDNDILMSFTRTFVLIPVETKLGILNTAIKYQIVNEQLSIYNPTTQQIKTAFKYFKTECPDDCDEVTISDKEAFIIMFREVTNLKSVWCTRFLDEGKWNFKKSLLLFIDYYDKKEIPDTAFN